MKVHSSVLVVISKYIEKQYAQAHISHTTFQPIGLAFFRHVCSISMYGTLSVYTQHTHTSRIPFVGQSNTVNNEWAHEFRAFYG